MIVINFSHFLTDKQIASIEKIKGRRITTLIDQVIHFDQTQPFAHQIQERLKMAPLSATDWQTKRILIVPPGHAPACAVLMAELHGRMGYFPEIIRIRPDPDGAEPFAIAEIISLQAVRDQARHSRQEQ